MIDNGYVEGARERCELLHSIDVLDCEAERAHVVDRVSRFRTHRKVHISADFTQVLRNRGKDTIYGTFGQQRNFSIRARRPAASTHTLSGILYVARQHSIEV